MNLHSKGIKQGTIMKIKATNLLVVFLHFIFIQNVAAKALDIYTNDEAPMNFEENGSIVGFSTDIVKEIITRTNSTDEIQLVPWARAYKTALVKNNTIVYTMGRASARETLFHWVGPIVQKKWVFYSLKKRGMQIKNLREAKEFTVGVVRNDARAQYLKAEGFESIYEVSDHQIAVNMLLKGRIDLWASSDFEGPIIIKNNGNKLNDFEITFAIKKIESYIAISKKTPMDIVNKWQKAFNDIKADGTLNKIAEKWSALFDIDITGENGVIAFKETPG